MERNDPNNGPSDLDAGAAYGRGRPGTVVRYNPKTGQRHLDELTWGLLPHDTLDPNTAVRPINARGETVATHPLFASAFHDRRAIIPMSVYYQRRWGGGPTLHDVVPSIETKRAVDLLSTLVATK